MPITPKRGSFLHAESHSTATDPVQLGLVASLNHPGGNATGVFILANSLEAKRLGLLHEMVPRAARIALLVNPQAPGAESQFEEAQTAARILSQEIVTVKASSETDLDAAFAILSHVGAEALLVAADPFFNSGREQLIALAARYMIPAIYEFREFPLAGGLMSYGTSLAGAYHQVGVYTPKYSRVSPRQVFQSFSRRRSKWLLISRQQRRSD